MDKTTLKAISHSWLSAAKRNIEIAKEKRWGLTLNDILDPETMKQLQVAENILNYILGEMEKT